MTRLLQISALLFLAACGGPTSEERAVREANAARNDAAVANAKLISVRGNTFRVAVIDDQTYALVDRTKGGAYSALDIEAAAGGVTGCDARFQPGVLAFVPGSDIRTENLAELRTKFSGKFWGWRVDLTC